MVEEAEEDALTKGIVKMSTRTDRTKATTTAEKIVK